MPNEALRNRFVEILREFYAADDAEHLANMHAAWHDEFLEKLKSTETLPKHVEARGVSLGKRLALLRRQERVKIGQEQQKLIWREVVSFLESVAPQLASPRQIVASCSIAGASRRKIEHVMRLMLDKGVISAREPESFHSKTFKLVISDAEPAGEEQEPLLAP